ncbi:hypothetical protein B9Z55_011215 [Caenorhabditis nigoni]|uniref:Uncharacterized protein n=1 Tax=Caenorhabditis nigoni TaxID=1611254 RepID=A0A2G5UK01_9PELO|nr:hypothetical protein B9Z55_011215 [Caenorhabditis nigoni]
MLIAVIWSDREYEYDMDLYNFDQAYLKMRSLKWIFSKTTKNQRILHCKRIHKHLQAIINPINYDAMTDEELLKRFQSLETREAEVDKLFEYQDPYFYPWSKRFLIMDRQKMQDTVKRFDEKQEYKRDLYNLKQAYEKMRPLAYIIQWTDKEERIDYIEEINEHIEAILKQKAPIDYDAMTYEKLVERYNFIKEKKAREQLFSWKPLINMCNSVKTACTESYESMKKKIGKNAQKQ